MAKTRVSRCGAKIGRLGCGAGIGGWSAGLGLEAQSPWLQGRDGVGSEV